MPYLRMLSFIWAYDPVKCSFLSKPFAVVMQQTPVAAFWWSMDEAHQVYRTSIMLILVARLCQI